MAAFLKRPMLKLSPLFAACLGLAIVVGCQPGKSPEGNDARTTKTDAAKQSAAEPITQPQSPGGEAKLTGRQVLERMVTAYHKASSYSDSGAIHVRVDSGDEKLRDDTIPFMVSYVRPNKLRLDVYQVRMVCDGRSVNVAIESLPNQVLVKPAPSEVSMNVFRIDPNLVPAIADFAGPPPQLLLLLSHDPMNDLLRDANEPVLLEPGQIDNGRDCYRVQIDRQDGTSVLWIDQKSLVLRRLVLPTDAIRQRMPQGKPIDRISLVADFAGAQLNGPIDPKRFEFESPKGAETVSLFVPPHMGQLLAKQAPAYRFVDLDGKPVTPESLAGKVAVIEFWTMPCREVLLELEKVREQYKNNPKVAFLAVNVDDQNLPNADVAKALADMKVTMAVARDPERFAEAFKIPGVPVGFILDAKGIVQDYDGMPDPATLVAGLRSKLDKVLAGENIHGPLQKEYEKQLEKLKQEAKVLESGAGDLPPPANEAIGRQEPVPEVKLAPRTDPARLKLTRLWKCADVRSPGNIAILAEPNGAATLAVIDDWNSVAEVSLDGKLIARHKLKLADKEFIGRLRVGEAADGHRYIVAFLPTHLRCHVFDAKWNQVADFPEDALQNPHNGMAGVELADLDGDGRLEMYIGYLGVVGVQGVPLPPHGNQRLWSNRSISNIVGMAIGGADAKGRRDLFCSDDRGELVALDAEGRRRGEIVVRNRMIGPIASADLRGDGHPLWCGLAAAQIGENVAVGFSPASQELWNYRLPDGVHQVPVEMIVAGRVLPGREGQWLLPGVNGSVHILDAGGRLLDRFNYGAALHGLAAADIAGHPAIIISSPNGLEAWRVE